tara:strand:- start:125 stop:349 length:225 start_codon:yes stop_codon:yes gene_type:complete
VKVGDLVTLSAHGKKLKRTSWVEPGDVGILKSVKGPGWVQYHVHWVKSDWERRRWTHFSCSHWFDRKDLKIARQ